MSMDPDGTNRIIKQQIRQWYSEVDESRNARLLDDESRRSLRSRIAPVARVLTGFAGRLVPVRRRPIAAPVVVAPTAQDSTTALAKGTSAP